MDRDLVNLPSFHTQIRKTVTGLTVGSQNHRENGEPHESTPLIGNGSINQNGNGNGHGPGHGHSETWEFLFNSHYTPGADNPKPWVKYPAHVWHITKATLLSSTYSAYSARKHAGRDSQCTKFNPDRSGQYSSRRRTDWHCRWPSRLGPGRRVRHKLFRHHPLSRRAVVCDRGNIGEAGRGSRWIAQCHFRQCCGVDRRTAPNPTHPNPTQK